MSNASAIRTIQLFRGQHLSPAALSKVLAGAARRVRDDLIRSGQAAPAYQTFVDGREGASEDQVRPDGQIVYRFSNVAQAVTFCLSYCIARSPSDSGAFRAAWLVAVNGRRWTGDLDDIPAGAEVIVTNPMPYARKVDTGGMRMRVPPGIVEGCRQAARSKFPSLQFERSFVAIPASIGAPPGVEVPYVLRGHAHLERVKQNRRSRAFRQGHIFRAPRLDTQRGQAMTYPALVITPRS